MTKDSEEFAIRVHNLGKRFLIGTKKGKDSVLNTVGSWITGRSPRRELWALRDVSFDVRKGEILGIIGANGAGKSTLLLLLAQILFPTEGGVHLSGRTNPFFQLSAGLQAELTVLENFSFCAALLGLSKSEFNRRLPEILAFSELEPYLYARYGELSTGLAARLPFSLAIQSEQDILLVDEMLSVGDQAFQAKCIGAFKDLLNKGKTLIVVSHSMSLIKSLCATTLYLRNGRPAFLGNTDEAIAELLQDLDVNVRAPDAAGAPSGSAPFIRDAQTAFIHIIQSTVSALEEQGKRIDVVNDDLRAQKSEFAVIRDILKEQRAKNLAETNKISSAIESLQATANRFTVKSRDMGQFSRTDREKTSCESANPQPASTLEDFNLFYAEARRSWKSVLGHSGPLAITKSSTSSIRLAISSLASPNLKKGMRAGDEVITTAINFDGVSQALKSSGLVPAFVDLDPITFNMDVRQMEKAIGEKTRAVVLPHLAGSCAPVDHIAEICKKRGLWFVELNDAGLGGTYDGRFFGAFGDIGTNGPGMDSTTAASWGLTMSNQNPMESIFAEIVRSSSHLSERNDERSNHYDLEREEGLMPDWSRIELSLRSCRTLSRSIADLDPSNEAAANEELARFLSGYPDWFLVPQPPKAAITKPDYFAFLVKDSAPFSIEDLQRALLFTTPGGCLRIVLRWLPSAFNDDDCRAFNDLKHSHLLMRRGIGIQARSDLGDRRLDSLEKLVGLLKPK